MRQLTLTWRWDEREEVELPKDIGELQRWLNSAPIPEKLETVLWTREVENVETKTSG